MKKIGTKIASLALIMLLVLSLAACGGNASEISFSGKKLENGKVGEVYSASVATATGSSKIYYELKNGQWLPEGLDMTEGGLISGTPTEAVENYEFTVVAYSDDSVSDKEASFTITIEAGTISGQEKTLKEGVTGELYADTLFATDNVNPLLAYALKKGETLPAGLKITEDGYLIGTPKEAVSASAFTVVVSGEGYEDTELEYALTIAKGESHQPSSAITFTGKALEDALVGEVYVMGNTALALGAEDIEYKRSYVGGIAFPKGLNYDSCGLLYGIAQDSTNGTLKFKVTASAEGYTAVTTEFTLNVLDKEVKTAQFEAEYINLTGKQGAGYSSSPSGKGLVQRFADASNGASVGFLLTEISLDFKVIATEDLSGLKLEMALASEIGNVTFAPKELQIKVNGVEINYGSIYLTGGSQVKGDIQLKNITDDLQLKKGENMITVSVLANTLRSGSTGGPIIDYIKISGATDKTSWRPKVSNMA